MNLSKGFIRLRADRTKTKVARSIPLHPNVKHAVSSIPRALHTNRVFLKDGKPFQDFKKSFRSACRESGLEDFTFHDLRHCAINNLRLAGNDYFKIMAVSGHKTVPSSPKGQSSDRRRTRHDCLGKAINYNGGGMDTDMDTKQKKATGKIL